MNRQISHQVHLNTIKTIWREKVEGWLKRRKEKGAKEMVSIKKGNWWSVRQVDRVWNESTSAQISNPDHFWANKKRAWKAKWPTKPKYEEEEWRKKVRIQYVRWCAFVQAKHDQFLQQQLLRLLLPKMLIDHRLKRPCSWSFWIRTHHCVKKSWHCKNSKNVDDGDDEPMADAWVYSII